MNYTPGIIIALFNLIPVEKNIAFALYKFTE